ncbi:MAG: hypothetical protein AB7T49_14480 [Oligoflexales bacterium]
MKVVKSFLIAVSAATVCPLAIADVLQMSDENVSAEVNEQANSIGIAFRAFGEDVPDSSGGTSTRPPRRPSPCDQVSLDEAQKASLRTAIFDHKKEAITLRAAAKVAVLTYEQTATTAGSTKEQADAAAAGINTAASNLVASKTTFATHILYDILTEEQRPAGYACLKSVEKHRGRGHRGEGRGRPGPGGHGRR